jgi:hypothetical protein
MSLAILIFFYANHIWKKVILSALDFNQKSVQPSKKTTTIYLNGFLNLISSTLRLADIYPLS